MHEPQRLAAQRDAGKLKLLPASVALVVPAPPAPEVLIACLVSAAFLPEERDGIEEKLAQLALGERQSRQNVPDAGAYIVYIPPQITKEATEKKAADLVQLGVRDFFVVQDQSKQHWGISLGIFKTEAAARLRLQNLISHGVHSARIGARVIATNKFNYQFKNLTGQEKEALEKLISAYPTQSLSVCK